MSKVICFRRFSKITNKAIDILCFYFWKIMYIYPIEERFVLNEYRPIPFVSISLNKFRFFRFSRWQVCLPIQF